jgi:hypothetical protein
VSSALSSTPTFQHQTTGLTLEDFANVAHLHPFLVAFFKL